MTDVTLNNLTKRYNGDVVAVNEVSISIEDGEFLTLVGPSGSGKSTILRMLAGIVRPTDGIIRFGDQDVSDVPPQERDVAMVFQNYALYPNMTVRENMEFGLKMQGFSETDRYEMVEEAAEMLQISELLDRKIQQLSGGQQQRVALGRSLVRNPKVFLLDEPLANLDAKLRVEMRTTLVELQRELNITTVYVTHNQLEAMTMSDRVAVVNYGEIQQLAEPQELFRNPANRFVADFIGTPTMNFVEAKIDHGTNIEIETSAFAMSLSDEFSVAEKIRENTKDGGTYELGIRPQHISLLPDSEHVSGVGIEMEVAIVETAGDELIVHLESNEERITAVVKEDMGINRGDSIIADIDPSKIHLFNIDDGAAVLESPPTQTPFS